MKSDHRTRVVIESEKRGVHAPHFSLVVIWGPGTYIVLSFVVELVQP